MRPVLLQIGPFSLYAYGFFLAVAFFFGTQVALRLARRENISEELVLNTVFGIVVSSLLGAKLLYLAVNWQESFASWEDFTDAIQRGFVFYGGFLSALVFITLYLQRHRERIPNILGFMDLLAPGTALGLGFARIGCFLSGCCYGGPCEHRFGVTFPPDSLPALQFGPHHHIHPAQLYESALGFLLFLGLLLVYRYRTRYGQVTASFILVYALFRPLFESLRADSHRGEWLGFTTSQLISIGLYPLALGMFWYIFSSAAHRLPQSSSTAR